MREYGLVLAGGGAKGAYQIGAWKALREMGITFNAITGVSIGAINGALIAAGDFDKALELWNNAQVKSGINVPFELKEPKNLFSISNLPHIFYEIIRNGGLDVSPAKELIGKYVDEQKVRNSGIPLGIVTFNLSGFKPIELFVEDMPNGQLLDYLMASARVPGLNHQGPDSETKYLDGGIYDNAPIGILRERGINKIIVIDISGIKGVGHKEDFSCANVVYIRPYDPKELGESFEFDKPMTEKRIAMGYLDTRKAFGLLFGRQYYFTHKEYIAMQKRYGYEALNELEKLATYLMVSRLNVYTERQFMRTLNFAYREKVSENQFHLDNLVKKAASISKADMSQKLKADLLIEKQFKKATEALGKYCQMRKDKSIL